ncbi:MAG: glycosyltransferase [Nitrolancea sp.]
MRVLLAHNSYLQPGGEDVAFEADATLLRDHGHEVRLFRVRNEQAASMGRPALALATLWNRQTAAAIRDVMVDWRPNILHLHNTFPLLSPSVVGTARSCGIPVVQTLHNYRLLCPNAQMFRDSRSCTDCVGRAFAWPAVMHRCYRESSSASAIAAISILEQGLMRRWNRSADLFTVLTDGARRRYIDAGFESERIAVRPNFLASDPGTGTAAGGYALFAGRLAPEKGVGTLLEAWSGHTDLPPLVICGDGPLRAAVETTTHSNPRVTHLGWQDRSVVIDKLKAAAMLAVPSLWSEGMPQIIVESLAVGTPVVASRLGAMAEMIDHGVTGLLFDPGDATDLARTIRQAIAEPDRLRFMRSDARHVFEHRYSAARNHELLMEIYATASRFSRTSGRVRLSLIEDSPA